MGILKIPIYGEIENEVMNATDYIGKILCNSI